MAWRSSSQTNAGLIANLVTNGLIKSDRVRDAMLRVDRGLFAPSSPYFDSPQSIGYGATISAPHMHAAAAESLLPFLHRDAHVLDVGSGSGYLTSVLWALVSGGEVNSSTTTAETDSAAAAAAAAATTTTTAEAGADSASSGTGLGRVVGIEHIQALADMGRKNVARSETGKKALDGGKLQFVKGDGRKGWPEHAPYDAIHVGAAAAEEHKELVEQLKSPGRLFIPVADRHGQQFIWIIDKDEHGNVTRKKDTAVIYVPLTDAPKNEL